MADSGGADQVWGWTRQQWATALAERVGAEFVEPRFAASCIGVLQRARAAGAGSVIRDGDASVVARFGQGDAVSIAVEDAPDMDDPWQAATARALLRERIVRGHVEAGVAFDDVQAAWIDATVTIAAGARIGPSVVLRGQTSVGSGATIQLGCHVSNTDVGAGAVLKPHTVTDGAIVGPRSAVGPSAHLRTGADLRDSVKVGNFVEVKKSVLHDGAKASHLTYIGDASIGAAANIGAGTITCNYDGYGKHKTTVGAGAFVGSNTALVAPVVIGEGAIVGAGSVISQDVPDNALAVERSAQRNLEGRAPRLRASNARRAGKPV